MIYVVQSGDTVFAIGRAVDSTVVDLRDANCLDDPASITTGDELYVPRLPNTPPLSDEERLVVIGCDAETALITSPEPLDVLTESFEVIGSASIDDFGAYTLSIRRDDETGYTELAQADMPVVENVLAAIAREVYPAGVYWLRLAVFNEEEHLPNQGTCTVPVRFD